MATCITCEREMTDSVPCATGVYDDFADGVTRARVPYPADEEGPCHDCATPPGALHHPGCDTEECPRCGGQAIGCGCAES